MLRRCVLCLLMLASCLTIRADEITRDRIGKLPAKDQTAWLAYVERSEAHARADEAKVREEVAARQMAKALRAPDGGDFKISAKSGDAWYKGEEAQRFADAILSYQTPSGGWSKHIHFAKGPRAPGMQWGSQHEPGKAPHYVATFDNRSTTEQIQFLANVWRATQRDDCRAGVVRGLTFIYDAQFPNGGWPQVYPLEGGYHDNITLNDDAMTHVLELLMTATGDDPGYGFLDDHQKAQAAKSLNAGIDCLVRMQVARGEQRTVWCAQHDALTLSPASARKLEPATLSGVESSHALRFLMTIPHPKPEVVTCIEAGLRWLEAARITGIAKAKVNGKSTYVKDPAAKEVLWARFYDLDTDKPIFPGRDGMVYDSFAAMAAKNEVGYDYYSTQPGSVLNSSQKKWRKMLAESPKR